MISVMCVWDLCVLMPFCWRETLSQRRRGESAAGSKPVKREEKRDAGGEGGVGTGINIHETPQKVLLFELPYRFFKSYTPHMVIVIQSISSFFSKFRKIVPMIVILLPLLTVLRESIKCRQFVICDQTKLHETAVVSVVRRDSWSMIVYHLLFSFTVHHHLPSLSVWNWINVSSSSSLFQSPIDLHHPVRLRIIIQISLLVSAPTELS